MLYFASLNSGSNGNCYYVGNDSEAVLVDAGISCRETEKRMRGLGLGMDKLKAIFISHEHGDHIKGLAVLSERYQLPVYMTNRTWSSGVTGMKPNSFLHFTDQQPVQVGGLSVQAFVKHHDASDPHSFVISCNNINVGVFTDIGACCDRLSKHFSTCHAAFLEANYDEVMLENGRYPYFLKNRIRGGHGHLSNTQALELFNKFRSPQLSHLLLSHLSKDNNCPDKALELFRPHAGNTNVVVASRYEASALYAVNGIGQGRARLRTAATVRPEQLTLFS